MKKSNVDATLGGALITGLGASLLLGLWGYAIPLAIMLYRFSKESY